MSSTLVRGLIVICLDPGTRLGSKMQEKKKQSINKSKLNLRLNYVGSGKSELGMMSRSAFVHPSYKHGPTLRAEYLPPQNGKLYSQCYRFVMRQHI